MVRFVDPQCLLVARLIAVLALILLSSSCSGGDRSRERDATPVILISIDTLRSDHLPAYGYSGVQTPAIDALRADSILFERAYSHCPLTVPSHATVFTGALPAENGMRDNNGYVLSPDTPTLAELLGANGYTTGGAVSAYVLRKGSGIERGFASWDDDLPTQTAGPDRSGTQRDGELTLKAAGTWLTANSSKLPFYFLHLYEPHSPYAPPEPFRSRYQSAYDGEIARVDELVGRYLTQLKAAGIYDKALIILFSDHGEGLNDHGEEEHGIFLYREALQVPLIIKLPDAANAGRSVSSPVQLSDIFPTVLDATGVKPPASPRSSSGARSLLGTLKQAPSQRQIYSETYFPRFHFGWSDLHSLISETHHFIEAPQPELYAVSDTAEKRNVLADNRRIFASMRRDIEPLIRSADAPKPVSTEEAAKLAALGYLGSASPADGPLPDPKTKTATFREIREAFKHFRAGRYEEALTFYQRLLRENPKMLDLWDISARALIHLGRHAEAIAAAKEGLKLSPQSRHIALMIADLELEQGNLDQAVQHAELALQSHPLEAYDIVARAALERGDAEAAERAARSAAAVDANDPRVLMTLGRIEKEKKNLPAALAHMERAAVVAREKKSVLSGLHYLRGDVLARLGRTAEAEAAFREEIQFFPQQSLAYRNLIVLYVAEGRLVDATKLVHDLERAAPTAPSYVAISETLRVVGDEQGARFWARRGLQRFPNDKTLKRLGG
jgi:choline-sulfatase